MRVEGVVTIGLWSDLDQPEVRAALHTLGLDWVAIRYLDGVGVPMRDKVRRVDGEPCPMTVLMQMEQHPAEPWAVRDRMPKEIGWCHQAASHPQSFATANGPAGKHCVRATVRRPDGPDTTADNVSGAAHPSHKHGHEEQRYLPVQYFSFENICQSVKCFRFSSAQLKSET
jgi:hypothetical protein